MIVTGPRVLNDKERPLDRILEMTKFFIGDTHFSHSKTWEIFKRADGTPLRPFTSTEEMDETMIANWNCVVNPKDTVIHLGDFVINRKAMQIGHRLNGKKRLVRRNHDIFKTQEYIDVGFEEILGVYVMPDIRVVCSHIPLHPSSLDRWNQNWHGHLHANVVLGKWNKPDPLYRNLSVEQINYTPIAYEELIKDM